MWVRGRKGRGWVGGRSRSGRPAMFGGSGSGSGIERAGGWVWDRSGRPPGSRGDRAGAWVTLGAPAVETGSDPVRVCFSFPGLSVFTDSLDFASGPRSVFLLRVFLCKVLEVFCGTNGLGNKLCSLSVFSFVSLGSFSCTVVCDIILNYFSEFTMIDPLLFY